MSCGTSMVTKFVPILIYSARSFLSIMYISVTLMSLVKSRWPPGDSPVGISKR